MERTVLLAAATWVGGVGAWAVGAGYALATHRAHATASSQQQQRRWSPIAPEMNLDESSPSPPPVEAELVDVSTMPQAPLALDDVPRSDGPSLASAAVPELSEGSEYDEYDDEIEGSLMQQESTQSLELRMPKAPDEALLTESQRRRLAPVKSLKRTRRSRKIRKTGEGEKNFVPLVQGARATTEDALVAAYEVADATIEEQRERGEDYWLDPDMLQSEQASQDRVDKSREKFLQSKESFGEEKLRQEIAAPYKNNLIVIITVGIGAAAVVFSAFPNLLELPTSITNFPLEL